MRPTLPQFGAILSRSDAALHTKHRLPMQPRSLNGASAYRETRQIRSLPTRYSHAKAACEISNQKHFANSIELPRRCAAVEDAVRSCFLPTRSAQGNTPIPKRVHVAFCAKLPRGVWHSTRPELRRRHTRAQTTQNAAGEDRTHDLRIMRPTRYQLRYCRYTMSEAAVAILSQSTRQQYVGIANKLSATPNMSRITSTARIDIPAASPSATHTAPRASTSTPHPAPPVFMIPWPTWACILGKSRCLASSAEHWRARLSHRDSGKRTTHCSKP